MALISCPECQKQVSTKAESCPGCGCPIKSEKIITSNEKNYVAPKSQIKIRPIGLFVGIMMIGFSIYMLFVFIPEHDFNNTSSAVNIDEPFSIINLFTKEHFHPDDISYLRIIGWIVLFLGVFQVLVGSTKRVNETLYCKKCDIQVGIAKKFTGNYCERCNKKINRGSYFVNVFFVFLLLILIIAVIPTSTNKENYKHTEKNNTTNNHNQKVDKNHKEVSKENAKIEDSINSVEEERIKTEENLKSTISDFIDLNKNVIADAIQSITHPTGENPKLIRKRIEIDENNISVLLSVEWQGGFTGKKYQTIVIWDFNTEKNIRAYVSDDTAITDISDENSRALSRYFKKQLYPVLKESMK